MPTPQIKLKVMEAVQDDVNRGVVKVDSGFMRQIGANPGDVIEIKGIRKTAALVDRAYPGDIGLNIIRMDGNTRRNARTSIGELVSVNKAEVKPAKKVAIAPASKGITVKASPLLFKQGLLGKAIVKGDLVSLGRSRRKPGFQNPMENVFAALEGQFASFGFGDIVFVVTEALPKNEVCVVTQETEVEFNPHAVELKEEEAISLGVNYEDIGGLGDEIKKVREMVELPLKHPEVFEKLGIEAPKGVLLHGPPGTGKTLLAKAVAGETSSHFILINGPEVMCVGGDTLIFTNPKGYKKAKEIYENSEGKRERSQNLEVISLKEPVSTYSFKDGKIEKAKITHMTKIVADACQLTFSDGNEIVASENQPFLVYRNGNLTWEISRNLKEGESVARLNKIGLEEKSLAIPLKKLGEKFDLTKKEGKYAVSSRNINRSNFIKIPKETSPQLLEFLGLLVSDGNISKKGEAITFCNKNTELLDYFKSLVKELFGVETIKEHKDDNCTRLVIYSRLLIELLKFLGFGYNQKIVIPPYFFRLPKEEIASFTRGYLEGDGSVGIIKIKNMAYPTPALHSANKEFLRQFQALLLLKLNISFKIEKNKTPKGIMYKLAVRGFEGRKTFLDVVGAVTREKKNRLKEMEKAVKTKEFMNIPRPAFLIDSIRKNLSYREYRNKDFYMYRTGKMTKHALKVLYELASRNKLINDSISDDPIKKEFALLNREDIGWEKITRVEKLGRRELYDFTVDKDSFVGGPYFLMHNSKWYGESEENLRKKFQEAEDNAPSIIFFDEIDAIATKREETYGHVEKRVVGQLLGLMDGMKSRGKVIVIAATNMPNSLDSALRRPGRFDRELEIGVPDKEGRHEILKIHTRNMPLAKDVSLKEIARVTHGFVGADLNALAKESAMIVLRRILPDLKLEKMKDGEAIPKEILEKLMITQKDFIEALKAVRPSALREVLVETPDVGWENIGGLEDIKDQLKEAVEWPLKRPEVFKRMGIRPPRGILLYGPPGTGKTMLAKAVAKESEANFILVNGPSLLSKFVGESERAVRETFRKARLAAPTILFFDEVDSLVPRRGVGTESHAYERVVNQVLTEMDGLESLNDVVVIAATNRPDMVDPALLRQGRFDRTLLTPIPDEAGRKKILEIYLKKIPIAKDVDMDKLAKKTDGYVGADIDGLCREAAMAALREDFQSPFVKMEHFLKAMDVVRPSVDKDVMETYQELKDYFSSARAKQIKEKKADYVG